ncbi:tyrosine phosphatase family-domain-containing protein [Syncephalis pseudoplumigaleata]|uniref:Tyrosine phosphatase family-domain-containing protein n=1 Tax=Syncephalis pseudoplumigaleata TaxID=1712513 RepID=A0A4P9YWV0_9FUNG|nr:tyrosine phosphatase family-domain-containing protein [Syncephalis pseudoplumigaleata]|eukprot:RKP24516.1 tyrosine phosphatase family-domain-containing protein [Syncephalis pseudoplumigaleata]
MAASTVGSDEADRTRDQPLVPPLNFALVEAGIYRSGHPNPKNYRFLEKLGLRSIIFLAKEDYPPDMLEWTRQHSIAFYQYRTAGNKEPFTEMDPDRVAGLLSLMLDVRNHPMLVHCNKGKHRVGCLIGCLRKLQNWSLTSILAEYKRLAAKQNIADEEVTAAPHDMHASSHEPSTHCRVVY